LANTGPYLAQTVRSGAHNENLDLMYLARHCFGAKKNFANRERLFLPDDLMRKELAEAAKRGVKVEVLVPGKKIDQKLVGLASRRHWPELIRAGIRIFEYQPTMVHAKL